MNDVPARVSAGSKYAGTSVVCTPHVTWPSGAAAAGAGVAMSERHSAATARARRADRVVVSVIGSSTPEPPGGEAGSLGEGGELEPRHARVRVIEPHGRGGEPAVGAGDDVLAADEAGESLDPLGDQLRVLDEVGGVADDTG